MTLRKPEEIKAALKERRQDPVMLDSSMGLLRSNFKEFVGKIPEGNLGVEYLMNPSGSSDRQEIQVESYRGSSLTIFPTPAPILT